MVLRIGISLVSSLVAAVLLAGNNRGTASEVAPEGVEVLGRGPVHEAFAQPLDTPQAGPVAPKAPPEPIEEQPPAQKPEGATWKHDVSVPVAEGVTLAQQLRQTNGGLPAIVLRKPVDALELTSEIAQALSRSGGA